jgi:arylsulfatase A-like enzyme
MNQADISVPGWLPDLSIVRNDILDYYFEIQKFDQELGEIIRLLKASGQMENTLIVITGDNGMPFPRAKATLYDAGSKVPLIISFSGQINAGIRIAEFVSLTDIAPTILELTNQTLPSAMSGRTLWPLLKGEKGKDRTAVFIERERHANVRKPELGYPSRAIRTADFLYIRNYAPDRWPAGDPDVYHSVGPYGDADASPSKQYILDNRSQPAIAPFFSRAFGKRPAEELYDLRIDPDQLNNVASDKKHRQILADLRRQLEEWQTNTADPRASNSPNVVFDQYPYFGPPVQGAPSKYRPPVKK